MAKNGLILTFKLAKMGINGIKMAKMAKMGFNDVKNGQNGL